MVAKSARRRALTLVSFEFSPFPGGHGTYATEMARVIGAQNDLKIIVPKYESDDPLDSELMISRVLTHQRLDIGSIRGLWSGLFHGVRPEAILACYVRAALALILLGQGRRVVAMFHGSEILKARRSLFARAVNVFVAWFAHAVVANSTYTAGLVKE